MTTSAKITNTGDKNLILQLFVEGGRGKNKKADPIVIAPGKEQEITVWPGIAAELKEEYNDTDESGE